MKLKTKTKKLIKKSFVYNFFKIVKVTNKNKIFCISFQRNGTTSVGDFLEEHGIKVARWGDSYSNNWSYFWYIGNYEKIFNTNTFKANQAYEDSPWWHPDFYKVLYHRFPNSKFILFYRDPEKWFDSMLSHSNGKTLGSTEQHCYLYRRMSEFYNKLDNDPFFKPKEHKIDNLMTLDGKREHYIKVYEEYNRGVLDFFRKHNNKRIFISELTDNQKWVKLGEFLNIKVEKNYQIHSNKSKR